ncbi:MAG: hypothetical protein ACYS47_01390, partial [Planctomycetota bacterium]|jgi:hypothetical protein
VDDEEPPPPDDEGKTAPPKPLPRSPLEGPPPGEPAPDYQPPKPRDPNEVAKEWYEDAERFARQFPHLTLQIVAAFFRVADNFRDTEWGKRALEKSIAYAKGWKDGDKGGTSPPKASPTDPKQPAPLIVEDPTLLRLRLRSQDPAARVAALNSLVHSIGSEAVSDLHEMFLGETEPSVRKVVLSQLIRLKDKRTRKAFKTFWNMRDKQIAEDFIRLVCAVGSDKEVRYAVYTTVMNVDRLVPPRKPAIIDTDGDALDAYISNVQSAYGMGLRSVLVESVRKMGKKGTKGLTGLFKRRGLATREAILTLGIVGDVKAGGKYVVIYLAQYKAGVYLGEALASLKMMGDEAIPFLIQTLGKPKLKQWAGWLLRNISGRPYSSGNPAKWWAWYREYKRGR